MDGLGERRQTTPTELGLLCIPNPCVLKYRGAVKKSTGGSCWLMAGAPVPIPARMHGLKNCRKLVRG